MKKINHLLNITFLTIILLGCGTSKKLLQTGNSFVDSETPTTAKPFVIDTAKESTNLNNWKMVFSDEFNDNTVDTTKWTVENATKKRVDVTLYANNKQVEEKNGNVYIYYSKASTINDTSYYAGRFNSKGKYSLTYGFLETRMHRR